MIKTAIAAPAAPSCDNVTTQKVTSKSVINKAKQSQQSFVTLENAHNEQQTFTAGDIYKSVLRDYPDVLDVSQVSAILGVSSKVVYRLLNEGSLASLKVGRAFKIPKVFVLQYIKVLARTDNEA